MVSPSPNWAMVAYSRFRMVSWEIKNGFAGPNPASSLLGREFRCSRAMSPNGTSRTWRNVRLEFAMRTRADMDQP